MIARTFLLAGALCLLLAVFSVAVPTRAYACVCSPPGASHDEFEKSDAVFKGSVIGFEQGTGGVLFDVSSTFKGVSQRQIIVGTGSAAGGDCPIQFKIGESYLVYARYFASGLYTDSCDRTMLLKEAAQDLTALSREKQESSNAIVFAGIIAIVFVLLISLFIRSRRNTR